MENRNVKKENGIKTHNIITKKLNLSYQILSSPAGLSREYLSLLKKARTSAGSAYAPYSEFNVGAAILLKNGRIILGNNQENAAYPSGLCAERVAVFSCSALYPGAQIKAIAINAFSTKFTITAPIPPCGGCLQSLLEYEAKQKTPIVLLLQGEKGDIFIIPSVSTLLPLRFDASKLLAK